MRAKLDRTNSVTESSQKSGSPPARRFRAGLAGLMLALAGLASAPAANIVFVSDTGTENTFTGPGADFADGGWVTLLQSAGHNVIRYNGPNSQNTRLSAVVLTALNTNDLIIVGRAVASGAFQAPQNIDWNVNVTKPLMTINAYLARQTRLGWFMPATENDDTPTTVTALDLNDLRTAYIFGSVAMNGNTTVNAYDEALGQNTSQLSSAATGSGAVPTNGNRLATALYTQRGSTTQWKATIIAEWQAGSLVRSNLDVLGGYRLYFAAGNREPSGGVVTNDCRENLSATGESMFLKAVEIAINRGNVPYDPSWPVGFTSQPQSATLLENNPVTFSAIVTGAPPIALQWERSDGQGGFTNIPGATSAAYTIPLVTPDDDDAQFRLTATNNNNGVISDVATLTVQTDVTLPTVTGIAVPATFNTVIVSFSEKVVIPDPVVNFTLDGLDIYNAALDSTGTKVILTTAPMTLSNSYVLTIQEITDTAAIPNGITPTNITVLAPVLSCGFVRGDYYTGITGSAVDGTFTNSAQYLTSFANDTRYFTSFNSQSGYAENYGLRMWGWFIPPTNGNYTIYVRSDDSSMVYFSVDDNPANETLIAMQNGANVEYTNTAGGTPRFSTVANLLAGQRYFMEAFLKEGTGGDYITVVAKAEGEPWPESTNAATVNPIPGSWFCSYADPNGVSINITNQPADVTVLENFTATFTVGAAIAPADRRAVAIYQWQKNGEDIPGATTATYTIPVVPLSDNGASYQCVIIVPGLSAVSSAVTLTVEQDTAPPVLLSMGSLNGRQIGLVFNEWLDAENATDEANYIVNDYAVSVTLAELRADRKSVILTLDTPVAAGYTVTASYAKDIASTPNEAGDQTLTDGLVVRPTWLGQDVGSITDPVYFGSTWVGTNDGRVAMRAGGTDIWGSADAMHYVYETVVGDFEAMVRVESLSYVDPATKCGILARESIAASSRNVAMVVMPPAPGRNLNVLQWRDDNGGASASRHLENSPDAPTNRPAWPNAWLKLQRSGSVFTGYFSSNAMDWVLMGSRTNVNMPATMVVGLGATAHNNSSASTFTEAVFGNYQLNNPQTDLTITKSGPSIVINQSNATFTITVENHGPGSATNVIVTDTLPAGLTFISAVSSQGACTSVGSTVRCDLGILDPAASVTITLGVKATTDGLQVNTASVTSTTGDPNAADNTATASVTVITPVGPTIDKGGLFYSDEGDGEFSGSFPTQAGISYVVEYKDTLNEATWTELVTIVGDGAVKSFTDPGPLPPTRFYQIRLVLP